MREKYVSLDYAYDQGTLTDWYISSVSPDDDPVWTDEHIDELMNDFYLIPKDSPTFEVESIVHGHWIDKVKSKYPKPDVFDTTCVNSESFKLLDWIKKQISDSQSQTDRWKQLERVVSASIKREYEKTQK